MRISHRIFDEFAIPKRCISSWTQLISSQPSLQSKPQSFTKHEYQWIDEYAWIKEDPLQNHAALLQEAAYFRQASRQLSLDRLASKLYDEMLASIPSRSKSTPERIGSYEYYVEQTSDKPLPHYKRCPSHADKNIHSDQSTTILDINELSQVFGDSLHVEDIKLSKCCSKVAFTLSQNGLDSTYALFIADIDSKKVWQHRPRVITTSSSSINSNHEGSVVSVEWSTDGETLFYTVPDATGRPYQVHQSNINNNNDDDNVSGSPDTLIFEENDPKFFVSLQRTKDWNYLVINSNSKTSSEVHLLDLLHQKHTPYSHSLHNNSTISLTCVQPRKDRLEYFVEHNNGHLYILSNARNSSNYALFTCIAPTKPLLLGEDNWHVLLEESSDISFDDMDMFSSALVLYERHGGKPRVRIVDMAAHHASFDKEKKEKKEQYSNGCILSFPEWVHDVTPGANPDFLSSLLRLELSSPIHVPLSVDIPLDIYHRCSSKSHGDSNRSNCIHITSTVNSNDTSNILMMELIHNGNGVPPSMKGFTLGDYTCEYHYETANSNSSTNVPITVLHKKGIKLNNKNKCLVLAYGAYGQSLPSDFLPEKIPLLERNWVVALVHARGGGELGRRWHEQGRGRKKENTINDIDASIEYLINKGYSQNGLFAIEGSSAGGIALASLLNRRPDTFGAVVLESPFVDVVSTMIDPDLFLTQHEYDEFGNPEKKEEFDVLKKICPYHSLLVSKNRDPSMASKNQLVINKRSRRFPPMLLLCSEDDQRVASWGILKYAAKIRQINAKNDIKPLVLVAPAVYQGHLPSDSEKFKIKSLEYAFLIKMMDS